MCATGRKHPRAAVVGVDKYEEWEETNQSKEPFVQIRSGTLFDYTLLTSSRYPFPYLVHRSKPSRQIGGPGIYLQISTLQRTLMSNRQGRFSRSTRAAHISATTLFMQLWEWLDVNE